MKIKGGTYARGILHFFSWISFYARNSFRVRKQRRVFPSLRKSGEIIADRRAVVISFSLPVFFLPLYLSSRDSILLRLMYVGKLTFPRSNFFALVAIGFSLILRAPRELSWIHCAYLVNIWWSQLSCKVMILSRKVSCYCSSNVDSGTWNVYVTLKWLKKRTWDFNICL